MKFNKSLLSLLLVSCFIPLGLQSQTLSKSESDQIKEELKRYKKNPLLYKIKMEQFAKTIDDQDEELSRLQSSNNKLKKDLVLLNDSIILMHRAIEVLIEEAEMAEAMLQKTEAETTVSDTQEPESKSAPILQTKAPEGWGYKVQVGRYKSFDITQYFNEPKVFTYAVENGNIIYHIGYFKDYNTAIKFAEEIKKMGIKDAFVVSYIDGERIEDATKN